MNKKATDKIISIYWFAILFIVAVACVYLVYSFYGKPYDVREIEANFLINKIVDCISENGILNLETLENPFLLEFCHLNFNVEEFEGWNDNQIYAEIFLCEFDFSQGQLSQGQNNCVSKLNFGNPTLKENCGLSSGGKSPVCLNKSSYFIDAGQNKHSTKIFVAVRKTEKND